VHFVITILNTFVYKSIFEPLYWKKLKPLALTKLLARFSLSIISHTKNTKMSKPPPPELKPLTAEYCASKLESAEKSVQDYNSRILELTIKYPRSEGENEALELLKSQLTDLKEDKKYWKEKLDIAQKTAGMLNLLMTLFKITNLLLTNGWLAQISSGKRLLVFLMASTFTTTSTHKQSTLLLSLRRTKF
jgi:hypothetical protein